MTHEEYLAERAKMINSAKELASAGKLEDAKNVKKEIEKLDHDFEDAANALASIEAMNGAPAVPKELQNNVAQGAEGELMEDKIYNVSSIEYRNAWLKNMAVDKATGEFKLGKLTEEEQNAYTMTTGNSGALVPTEIQNRIIELVDSMAPMYDDATQSSMDKGFGVPRHKAINAGDAAKTAEGAANADEEDEFDLLSLDGVEIKKHINITRKMSFTSIDAFEDWIVKHLAERIAVAKEARIRERLDDNTVGIDAGNVLTAQTYEDATIRSIFAKIKGMGAKAIYANNATIWNGLFGIKDGQGNNLFIPDATGDPVVQGRIYGALVKQDENIADNVAYIGVPSKILANDFIKLEVAEDVSASSFVKTIGGLSIFDAGLENPLSFVKVTFTV
jgi:HK97 family phage major capsid protein